MAENEPEAIARFQTVKDVLGVTQSFVTVIAVIVGGAWTYKNFDKERHAYARLNLGHQVHHVFLTKNRVLLHVGLELNNTGLTRVTSKKITVWIQQILPILSCKSGYQCLDKILDDASNSLDAKDDIFEWPILTKRTRDYDIIELEPGEKETVDFEFIVPDQARVLKIYTYTRNEDKFSDSDEFGWTYSSYYSFPLAAKEAPK